MSVGPLFVVFVLTHLLLLNSAEEDKHHIPKCEPFKCGKLGEIGWPYKEKKHPDHCGLYTVDCSEGNSPKVQLKEGGHWYQISEISQADSIFIDDTELRKTFTSRSCESLETFGLPSPSLSSILFTPNILNIFKCNSSLRITPPTAFNSTSCRDYNLYYTLILNRRFIPDSSLDTNIYTSSFAPHCSFIQLPANPPENVHGDFFEFQLPSSFYVTVYPNLKCWKCQLRGGQCLLSDSKNQFRCSKEKLGNNVVRIAAIGTTSAGLVLMVFLCYLLRKFSAFKFIYLWKKPNQAHQNVEAFLKEHGSLSTRRYSYSYVKQMANNFIDKIGQGGYGTVYKGKLKNGHLVAVKFLNKSKGNGEEFINEVATISRTSHVNIVSLLGFCFEGPKRALIYEFMPNGSLEKFIFKENGNQNDTHQLEWRTLFQISLGIARGLEYLHRGCNTRILHFDIKPHNILLDEDFTPKISDFGLAKVCTREESIVSMLDARGTIGYIAPEVFSRNFGGVSHKSDVYSYGMMVLEMVGGRKNVNVGVDNISEIYFPHWIYKRIKLDEELRLKRIMSEDEKSQVRKMIMVSLWCIQTDPSNRPTMSRVIEMLEGSVNSLEVPPKPYLSSPPRSSSTEFSSGFASLQVKFST